MSARRGPNVTPTTVYAYKPTGEAGLRQGIWVTTSTYKHFQWHELRQAERTAIIGSLMAMGISLYSIMQAVDGRIEWPWQGSPWSMWIPNNIYKQVLNTQKGARP